MAVNSVSAGIFRELFSLYMVIALIVGALVLAWLGYILVRYRARPEQPRPRDAPRAGVIPAERGHPIWSYVMAIVIAAIMFGLAFGTISAVHTLEEPPEEGDRIEVTVTGFQFGWGLTYEGAGGIPLRENARWVLPEDTNIVATVISTDVWHNFALPDFRMRIDAIPGQPNHIWWRAEETGTVRPVCVQLCGTGHALMNVSLTIVTKEEFSVHVTNWSERAYNQLATQNQIVNVTVDGSGFSPDTSGIKMNAPHAYRVHNVASSPVTVTVNGEGWTIQPGEVRLLWEAAQTAAPQGGSSTEGGH